ncbi:MAG: long-chain fatty acid--CoA ligase [Deltaproteobacteria bacterium]|jgi:long-chain acyl-CoA synthetase|nr:long-chain fatty acid--CoA ligase [Deltaproteobacteria bacterium]
MQLNLGVILHESAIDRPDHVAVRLNERELTYAEIDRQARGIATALLERGIVPGQKVALLIPNVPEFTSAYFAILYAGFTAVPLNVLLSAPEITYHLEDSGAQLLIAHPFFAESVKAGAEAAGVPIVWTNGEGDDALEAMVEQPPLTDLYPTLPTDTAVVLYTSGTTGKPKGAELTHSNLFFNCSVVVPRLMPVEPDVVLFATLPLFHSFGQTCVQNVAISMGGTVTMLPRFTPEDAFKIMERDRVTVFTGVPTMYFALLHHECEREYDLSSLKYCMSGGAPMPVEIMKAFEAKYPVQILEGYGLSETSPVASFNMLSRPRHPGSIGYPVWGTEMRVVDENDRPLPDGEAGEICMRGHHIMKGYLNRPDATKDALRGGWFHSGDIGIRSPEGYYTIVDRKKDMILRGGFNVYPREVEEVLSAHDSIVEAAVIGIPDEEKGEEVKAIVVLAPGAELSAEDVIAFCKQRLAAYKYPRVVEFMDALPKGSTGKILKRELS